MLHILYDFSITNSCAPFSPSLFLFSLAPTAILIPKGDPLQYTHHFFPIHMYYIVTKEVSLRLSKSEQFRILNWKRNVEGGGV